MCTEYIKTTVILVTLTRSVALNHRYGFVDTFTAP